MGGTRAVRGEPGKQKPRSALFTSRPRDCGRGNSPEAAPKQKVGVKGENAPRQFIELRRRAGVGNGDGAISKCRAATERDGERGGE